MKPTVGRIVHFVGNGVAPMNHYAAIITHVHTHECVNLFVFPKSSAVNEANAVVRTAIAYGKSGDVWTWHWPEWEE